jgi:membrane associated rhomboid family serine protease
MSYPFADEHEPPPITPAVKWLIATNVAVFFLQVTVVGDTIIRQMLAFQVSDLTSGRWWTIGTYMFVHGGILHLAVNMYTLWMFGRRVEHVWSPGAFTRFYLWCGLGGWLFHLLFARNGSFLLGASAAVFGVMLAFAMRWPDEEVFLFGILPMKVKWLVTALVVFTLVLGIGMGGGTGGVAYFAHLGGLAFAWLYLRTPSAQSIERLKQRVSQLPDVQDETPRAIPRSLPRQRERERGNEIDEIVAKSKAVVTKRQPAARPVSTKKRDTRADELNLVLDKISQQGLGSLTSDERKLLEEMSKELRKD